jgi:hypothetical protein
METFSRRLAEELNANVSGIKAFAETFPAQKQASGLMNVCVTNAGDSGWVSNRFQFVANRRITVGGGSDAAMQKAIEIYEFFFPRGQFPARRMEVGEYMVFNGFPDGEPRFFSNAGNIFFAGFVAKFLVARDY